MSIFRHFKEVMAGAIDKAAQLLFRQNVSISNDETGALLDVHDERAEAKRADRRTKEREKAKAHGTLMRQIQDHINDLQRQIDALQDKIDVLEEEKTENTSQIDKNKERMEQLKSEGKDDSPEYLALVAANEALELENRRIQAIIDGYKQDQDNLQKGIDKLKAAEATADPAIMKQAVEEANRSELYAAREENFSKESDDTMAVGIGEQAEMGMAERHVTEVATSELNMDSLFNEFEESNTKHQITAADQYPDLPGSDAAKSTTTALVERFEAASKGTTLQETAELNKETLIPRDISPVAGNNLA